jgi:3-deoxy-7-phosphoheptulonate synthase
MGGLMEDWRRAAVRLFSTMQFSTDDIRIQEIKELVAPTQLIHEFPVSESASGLIFDTRQSISNILYGNDNRLLMVAGPCSIHDTSAAIDYAGRLLEVARPYRQHILTIMRVYFEKPRTTVGWKGLINDPYLDGSCQINDGLRMARKLLIDVNGMGLAAGTEFLDMISPQYFADLISWGAIGARTTESQVHRELASGLSCPVGFKNGTDGNTRIAIDAVRAARIPHHFLSVTKDGHSAIVQTKGNLDGHVILRGGKEPNYAEEHVLAAAQALDAQKLPARVMVDCSHANSFKDFRRQAAVAEDIAGQIAHGSRHILGVMVESNLEAGNQPLLLGNLEYGLSITDACVDLEETARMLELLAEAKERVSAGSGKAVTSTDTANEAPVSAR